MKIHLVGEAIEHEADLSAHLAASAAIVGLPADAAHSDRYDDRIDAGDVVVSLRFTRPGSVAPRFRLLHVPGAGLDGVDLDTLDPTTAVANVFEHEIPIAEFVLARMLEWEIRAGEMQAAFGADSWPETYRQRVPHGEVHGRTLGIIGYGRIGRAIATRAAAFGMRVRAVDDRADAGTTGDAAELLPVARLDEVVATADYLAVACPLTPDTTGLIDRAALHQMRSHAVLVNISRGPVVEESALFEALRDNVIGGAVMDVWYSYPRSAEDRPAPAAHPFWELPNAWCTPHSSAWTRELAGRRYRAIALNIDRLVAGQSLTNLVRAGR